MYYGKRDICSTGAMESQQTCLHTNQVSRLVEISWRYFKDSEFWQNSESVEGKSVDLFTQQWSE